MFQRAPKSTAALHPLQNKTISLVFFISIIFSLSLTGCAIKPQPLTPEEMQENVKKDLQQLFAEQEPLTKKISLYDAMARAIRYNLNHKVKLFENAIAKGALLQSQKDLLPQLVTSAGYSTRNNYNASFSKNLLTGSQSGFTELSISEEKQNFNADLIFVWNVLDFGVSYHQAKQQADQVLVTEEQRRKAAQNIAQDIRYAYWKAVSADELLPEMDALTQRVEAALEKSRKMAAAMADKPIKILDYQQDLLETVQQLWNMRRSLSLAKTELTSLMNSRPGSKFTFKLPKEEMIVYPEYSLEMLEKFALLQRPELISDSYQERIGSLEVRKAMLKMLPGLEFNLGTNYDNNDFLYNSTWVHAGINLSWNAFNLLSGPTTIKNAEMQRDLARQRRLATSMMVLTQVNLAKQQYHLALKEFQIANRLYEVHRRKLYHSSAAKKAKTGTEMEEIQKQVAALSSKMQQGLAFAELQGAIGSIYNSIGMDPLPNKIHSKHIKTLARTMKRHDAKLTKSFAQGKISYTLPNPFQESPLDGFAKTFQQERKQEQQLNNLSLAAPKNFHTPALSVQENESRQNQSHLKVEAAPLQDKIASRNNTIAPTSSTIQPEAIMQKPKGPILHGYPELYSLPADYYATNSYGLPSGQYKVIRLAELKHNKSRQLQVLAQQIQQDAGRNNYTRSVSVDGTRYKVKKLRNGEIILVAQSGPDTAVKVNNSYRPHTSSSKKSQKFYTMKPNFLLTVEQSNKQKDISQ